jgi:hypothetical protein
MTIKSNRLRRYFRHGMFPQLIAYEACIRHGSVTRAAEELSLAQPTVSCLVRKLSETMGAPLTMTRDRRIEPTPLGLEVIALCHELFEAFEDFDERRRRAGEGGGSDDHDPRGSGREDDVAAEPEISASPARTGSGGPALQAAASYDRRAALLQSPPWQSPYPQRRLSRSKPRALRCPHRRRRRSGTTGES